MQIYWQFYLIRNKSITIQILDQEGFFQNNKKQYQQIIESDEQITENGKYMNIRYSVYEEM